MPHSPVNTVSRITHVISPLSVSPKMEKLKIRTKNAWPHMMTNCVETCEKRISMGVMPQTRQRSSIPPLRSINMAPEVSATDRKKMMVRMTPGAAKSVKLGFWSP